MVGTLVKGVAGIARFFYAISHEDKVAVGHYTQHAHEVTLWQEGGLKTLLHEAVHAATVTEMHNHIVKSAKRVGDKYIKDSRGRLIWEHKVKNNSPIGKQLFSIFNAAKEAAEKYLVLLVKQLKIYLHITQRLLKKYVTQHLCYQII